jgi:hypothetical protein
MGKAIEICLAGYRKGLSKPGAIRELICSKINICQPMILSATTASNDSIFS